MQAECLEYSLLKTNTKPKLIILVDKKNNISAKP